MDFDEDDLDYKYSCGVCFEVFSDPRTLSCSHSMCNSCLVGIYRRNPTCPFCRSPFGIPLPTTNQTLLQMTLRFLEELHRRQNPMETDPSLSQTSLFFSLPKDVIFEIYKHLSYIDLARSSTICKYLQMVVEHCYLWRDYCHSQFPFCSPEVPGSRTWRNIFQVHKRAKLGWQLGRPKDFLMTPWRAHSNFITAFEIHRRNVVSGGADASVNIWNFSGKDVVHSLKGHSGPINALKFNEFSVISGSEDGTVRIWDTTAGVQVNALPHQGPVTSLFFNEQRLWTASMDGNVRAFDVRAGSCVGSFVNGPTHKIEPGPGGSVISSSPSFVKLYDTKTNSTVFTKTTTGKTCSYYPGGNKFGFGNSMGGIEIIDLGAGATLQQAVLTPGAPLLCLSAFGDHFVAGSRNGQLKLWNSATNSLQQTLADHTEQVNTVQMDDCKIVSGGADMCIKVWSRENNQRLYSLLGGSRQERGRNPPHPTKPGCSEVRFDQSRIVASFNSLLRVYSFVADF